MSLSRAFTTRRQKASEAGDNAPLPNRSLTTKRSLQIGSIRNKISAPVELLSTTNMLSYNAPDIYASSRSRASSSGSDSDVSLAHSRPSLVTTPMTSPDTSSIESSPTSLKPNHLSCYFGAPSRQSDSSDEVPMIPQRAPSHTKRSAEAIARKRSMSRMTSPKASISTTRSSINIFNPTLEVPDHPFGNELAQVSELAEEYSMGRAKKLTAIDEEEQQLLSQGFCKFSVDDYMGEIQNLYRDVFGAETRPTMASVWI